MPKVFATIDTNVFIRALEDDPPKSAKPASRQDQSQRQWDPSEMRAMLRTYLGNKSTDLVLHAEQLKELIKVATAVADRQEVRYRDASGAIQSRAMTEKEEANALDFLRFLEKLQMRLKGGHHVPHVVYTDNSGPNLKIWEMAARLEDKTTERIQVARNKDTDPLTDCIIVLNAYRQARQNLGAEHHIMTMDGDLSIINEMIHDDIRPLAAGPSSKKIASIPEPYKTFREFICYTNPTDNRHKTALLPSVQVFPVKGPARRGLEKPRDSLTETLTKDAGISL